MELEADKTDYDQLYSDSFAKKIPFPMMKYDTCKVSPAADDVVYTLASSSIKKETKFRLFTSKARKEALMPVLERLRAEAHKKSKGETKEEEKDKKDEQKKPLEELKTQEPDYLQAKDLTLKNDKKETKNPYDDDVEDSKKEPEGPQPTDGIISKAQMTIEFEGLLSRPETPHKNELEMSTKKISNPRDEVMKSAQSQNRPKSRQGDLNKETEKESFEEIFAKSSEIRDPNATGKLFIKWKVDKTGFKKDKEMYLKGNMNSTLEFSKDGRFILLSGGDSRTVYVHRADNLELVHESLLTAKDNFGNDVTYFYDTRLSYDGSYLIGGDSYSRYIFKQNGEFVKRIEGRNMYSIFQFSKTEFAGCINADDSYTKTNLVAVDFIEDKERVIYEFDSYISTIYLNNDNSGF